MTSWMWNYVPLQTPTSRLMSTGSLTIDLGKFMSRSTPSGFFGSVEESSAEYRWFVIVATGRDVGTICLNGSVTRRAQYDLGSSWVTSLTVEKALDVRRLIK